MAHLELLEWRTCGFYESVTRMEDRYCSARSATLIPDPSDKLRCIHPANHAGYHLDGYGNVFYTNPTVILTAKAVR